MGAARRRGVAPEAPEADAVLRELFGHADSAAVLERLETACDDRMARYRELLCAVIGRPLSPHREEFAGVVAALRVRTGR
ncbi:hypothetical protein ABZ920_25500 [Streptomyces sp. NPDC046831]|uniref:hypothetical protein n=1 Tax=Streptomyces sp. NPDC046831 TaxID=3154805 RepID=UPI0033C9F584